MHKGLKYIVFPLSSKPVSQMQLDVTDFHLRKTTLYSIFLSFKVEARVGINIHRELYNTAGYSTCTRARSSER